MRLRLAELIVLLIVFLPGAVPSSSPSNDTIAEAEKDFSDDLGLVLSDLSAEVAAKNRTFIAEKLAQIRNRKKKLNAGKESKAKSAIGNSDLTSSRVQKRLKRRQLKQKCLNIANHFDGSSKKVKKRIWKRMFRCFWNWLTSPIGMDLGRKQDEWPNRGSQRRRKKQKQRATMAADKRKEQERQMSREDIERNKLILKETFKRLNGVYRPTSVENGPD